MRNLIAVSHRDQSGAIKDFDSAYGLHMHDRVIDAPSSKYPRQNADRLVFWYRVNGEKLKLAVTRIGRGNDVDPTAEPSRV